MEKILFQIIYLLMTGLHTNPCKEENYLDELGPCRRGMLGPRKFLCIEGKLYIEPYTGIKRILKDNSNDGL